MNKQKYLNTWLIFVNIKPQVGEQLMNLVDIEELILTTNETYIGAWANVIIKANTINAALEILPLGLNELKFEIEFIDKIENIFSLIENNELKDEVRMEADWLLNSDFVFKISDKIFPYS